MSNIRPVVDANAEIVQLALLLYHTFMRERWIQNVLFPGGKAPRGRGIASAHQLALILLFTHNFLENVLVATTISPRGGGIFGDGFCLFLSTEIESGHVRNRAHHKSGIEVAGAMGSVIAEAVSHEIIRV